MPISRIIRLNGRRARGMTTRLETRSGVKWGKLLVLKSDVARWWPFVAQQDDPVTGEPTYRTGATGRPTSITLVVIEHTARWDRCEALKSIGAEPRHWRSGLWKSTRVRPSLHRKQSAITSAPNIGDA